MFRWHTVEACKPFNEVECRADTGSQTLNRTVFDLSDLSNPRHNYVLKLNTTATVVLNVCRSLVSTKVAAACPYRSAACLAVARPSTDTPGAMLHDYKHVDIGTVKDGPRLAVIRVVAQMQISKAFCMGFMFNWLYWSIFQL